MATEGPPQYNVVRFFNGIVRYEGNIDDYINAFNAKSGNKYFTIRPNEARTAVYVDTKAGAPELKVDEQGIIYSPSSFFPVVKIQGGNTSLALQRVGFPGNPWNNAPTPSTSSSSSSCDVVSSCGPSKEELTIPTSVSLPAKITVDRVQDLGLFLRAVEVEKIGSLQTGESASLGGGYCVFWMRYIAKKLAEATPGRLWDLEQSQYNRYSVRGVYATMYAEAAPHASDSEWKNTESTELISMALSTPELPVTKRSQRISTNKEGKAKPTNIRLCPFSSTAGAHNHLFRARVLQPLSAGKFRMATKSDKGYDVYATAGNGTWASKEFFELVADADNKLPILFFASINMKGANFGHALCCIYIPAKANHGDSKIDIISTYGLPEDELAKFKTLKRAPDNWSQVDADAKAGGRRVTRRVSKRKSLSTKRKKTQQRRNWFA